MKKSWRWNGYVLISTEQDGTSTPAHLATQIEKPAIQQQVDSLGKPLK
jgi:hypothetical protein